LKDSVKIPARRYMSITAEETQTKVVDDIVGEIKKVKENQ
jgi:phage gpG-like protein